MRRVGPEPTVAVVRFLFDYDRSSGVLRWRVGIGGRTKSGSVAGCASTHGRGYVTVRLFGRRFFAHVLAWVIVRGRWPNHPIDHVNNQPGDNRWCNLRKADESENRANSGRYANNTSGFKGVHFNARRGKYLATITYRGKTTALGAFDDPKTAGAAYRDAARRIHGQFARTE